MSGAIWLVRRARSTALLVPVLSIAVSSCSASHKITSAATTSSAVASTTGSVSPDVRDEDLVIIKRTFQQINDAWNTGIDEGLRSEAAQAWPPGKVTAADVACAFDGGLSSPGTARDSLDHIEARLKQRSTYERVELVGAASVSESGGWTIPNEKGYIGAGTTPAGRTYAVEVNLTQGTQTSTRTIHVVVLGDQGFIVKQVCEQ